MSNSRVSASSTRALAQRQYHKAVELEKQLFQLKGPSDPNARILRNNIRELYEFLILEDHEFAELHEVEQSLWRLHYARIEDFRAQLAKFMAAAGSVPSNADVGAPINKTIAIRDPGQKIKAEFRSFLSEASGFYHDLILKIRAKHGLPQDDLTCNTIKGQEFRDDEKKIVELKRCQHSCHRCLIYLGDLARYKVRIGGNHEDGDIKNHDYSIAAGFYMKAASIWSASGNPHNQLAVMATYVSDEMLAVYHYFRSLAAESPFLTAKDNLVLLFEKNRQSYLRLAASSSARSASKNHNTGEKGKGLKRDKVLASRRGSANAVQGRLNGDTGGGQAVNGLNATEILKKFRILFVRVNGILFTKTSLETFPEVHSSVLSELEKLLEYESTEGQNKSLLSGGSVWGAGPTIVLQLVSILIFSVHNVSVGHDAHKQTYADILQQSAILEHAFIATFDYAGRLIQHCVKAGDASKCPMMPAVLVILEWLSSRPEMVLGVDIKEQEENARGFFWKNCVYLLNRFLDEKFAQKCTEVLGTALEDCNDQVLLWEDSELHGFTPLLPIQGKLDYTTKPNIGVGSEKDIHARVQRLIDAGKIISGTFEGSDKGIVYDALSNRFYLASEKKNHNQGNPQSKKNLPVISTFDKPMSQVKKSDATEKTNLCAGDEEDEVIVFKPSTNLIKESQSANVNISCSNQILNSGIQTSSSEILPEKPLFDVPSFLKGAPKIQPDAYPMTDNSVANTSDKSSQMVNVTITSCEGISSSSALPADVGAPTGSTINGGTSHDFKTGNMNANANVSSGLNTFPRSLYEKDPVSGSGFVDWGGGTGFGLFQSQQPWSSIPNDNSWRPQNVTASSSLWNQDLHRLAALNGSLGVQPNVSGPPLRQHYNLPFPSTLPFPQMKPDISSIATNGTSQNVVPAMQASKALIDDSMVGQFHAAPKDVGISSVSNPYSKAISSNDLEKSTVITTGRTLSMRPPPGFGPIPLKPGPTMSASSVLSPPQNAPLAQHLANNAQPNDELVDDYGWLDGYVPVTRSLNQINAVNADHKMRAGVPASVVEAALSPFPGMRLSDHSTPISTVNVFSQIQQDSIKQQILQEQYQRQLRQEQQRQQLYNAQLANQWSQHQVQIHKEHPLKLQQQMSTSFWPGQSTDVS